MTQDQNLALSLVELTHSAALSSLCLRGCLECMCSAEMVLWKDICKNNHPEISSVSGQVIKGRCYAMVDTCDHTFFMCTTSSSSLKRWTIMHPQVDSSAHVQS